MTARPPSATVAMVAWNCRPFVGTAIRSVLAQEFREFELIVIDDASTDGTWKEISGFTDPRVRRIRNERTLGEYRNRNQAISLAQGEFLVFVDGDDYLYPHGLGFLVRALRSFPRSAFASAQSPSEKFIYPVELTPHEFLSCQFLGPNVTGQDFTRLAFRTACLRARGGFDLRYRTGDTHIQFALGMASPCVLVSDGVSWWRRRRGQASEALHAGRWGTAELTRYGMEILAHPDCPLTEAEKRIAKANLARTLMRSVAHFALRGQLLHAWRLFRASGLPARDCVCLFAREKRPYLAEVSGERPIGPFPGSALATPEPGIAVDGVDSLADAVAGAEVVDRPAASGQEPPIVDDHVPAGR